MKKFMILAAVSLLAVGAVEAATITWETPTMATADTDISTSGSLLYAERFTTDAIGSGVITLNGVDFEVASKGDGGNIEINTYANLETNDSHADSYATLSADYRALYAGDYYSADDGTSIVLNNLTVGHSYQVQLWSGDDRYGADSTLRIDGSSSVDLITSAGEWVLGSFWADSTTQSLNFLNGGASVVNAVQVRTISSSGKELGAIWFIGDSVTQSDADGDPLGSPRKSLYDLLIADGYTFSYTGHHAVNTDGLPITGAGVGDNLYHYHSGVSGSMIGDNYLSRVGMTQNMSTFWTSGRLAEVKPNIILIMLGTNDVGQQYDLANAPSRLKALLENIYELPGIGSPVVYLASVPPNGKGATQTANVISLNSYIPGIVSECQSEGKNVHFVDQFTPLNDNYDTVMRGDNLHPNATGNTIMAQAWFDAISSPVVASIDASPLSGAAPLTIDFDAFASAEGADIVSYSWSFGDGTTSSGVTTSHTYTEAGTYNAVLIATTDGNERGVASVEVKASEWPGAASDFNGYDMYTFTTDGLDCRIAVPDTVAEGKPWVWRARFWGHKPDPDIALLGHGYHVAYVDVANLFGSPAAVARFDAFYGFLTEEHGFDDRAVLEGMSRGGLAIYNWAAENPEKVHCVYADAPVCDFKSWPAGLYDGTGSGSAWTNCLAAYGFTEEEAIAYGGNPVDNMQALANAGVPLLHVVGDVDTTVPVAENTAILESRYKALGGWIEVIHKPGVGHVHGLGDSSPIVDFILNSMNVIHNLESTDVEETTARLNGLLSLPEMSYDLQVYWGLTDGEMNEEAWENSASIGSWITGDSNLVSFELSSLIPGSTYYYSFSASNENGRVWDDSLSFKTSNSSTSSLTIEGSYSDADLAYGSFVSASDLVNAGMDTLASGPTYSVGPNFGPSASNDGSIGVGQTSDITFWTSAAPGNTYTITYALDTAVNSMGYDINSLQTIHGWGSNSGNQKNQNYTVEVSTVDSAGFFAIGTVSYLPFDFADTAGSSMVTVSDSSGVLASKVDEIRFTYTIPESGGKFPSPAIREIDVFGIPTGVGDSVHMPVLESVDILSNGNFNLTFSGTIGEHYWVQSSEDLLENSWVLVTDIGSLENSPMEIDVPMSNEQIFYRIVWVQ